MGSYVQGFDEIDRARVAVAGGKGANLGELSRIEGVTVPPGFCVTTDAFRAAMATIPSLDDRLDRLSTLDPADRAAVRALSTELREVVEQVGVPEVVATAITDALAALGEDGTYAVRSSATAEDLPSASFAGQQDTYLNVTGTAEVLRHVSRCWASLFTERAVTYRLRNGVDHRTTHMAVIVQRLVAADASGVLFTADPVTSNRRVASVEATFGLGEGLVSGIVTPDAYTVRDGRITSRAIATKPVAVHARRTGGTEERAIDAEQRDRPALTDERVVDLVELGRRIEAHFGAPQDIEWCVADDEVAIVQSRPITTLFPIPAADDDGNHVYVSVGHQQMMTDAMKPLGISMWLLTTPAPAREAGGRLFVDLTPLLSSPAGRAGILTALGTSDPLIRDALETLLDRGDVIPPLADGDPGASLPPSLRPPAPSELMEADPAVVADLVTRAERSLAAVPARLATTAGEALLDAVLEDLQEMKRVLFDPESLQVILAGMEASRWLNEQMQVWLGETNAADTLTQSVPDNVTSEMGLALLDVADVVRPHPEVVAHLRVVVDEDFLDTLPLLPGGAEARAAIEAYLDRYGARCVGEIDITRPRWRERPSTLLPVLLGHVDHAEPGAGARRFEKGLREAERTRHDLLARVERLPDGASKAAETRRMIDRVRTFTGYREYPKYAMVRRYFLYKQALLAEAGRLVRAGVLRTVDDIFFLTFAELHDVVRTQRADLGLVDDRARAFASYQSLTPPRVLTSEGETLSGRYRRDGLPPGALVGLPVSVGTVEGRARVVADIEQAELEPGDILVTAFTDPSWTPLFVTVAALVTEVGGLMTHGAVIAREYGLPAVVGVEGATRLIRDGQRIRVNGTDGYVELLATGP